MKGREKRKYKEREQTNQRGNGERSAKREGRAECKRVWKRKREGRESVRVAEGDGKNA